MTRIPWLIAVEIAPKTSVIPKVSSIPVRISPSRITLVSSISGLLDTLVASKSGISTPTRKATRAIAPKDLHTLLGSSVMRLPASIICGVRAHADMIRPKTETLKAPTTLTKAKITPMNPNSTDKPIAMPAFQMVPPIKSQTTMRATMMPSPTGDTFDTSLLRLTPRGVTATRRIASIAEAAARIIISAASAMRIRGPTHISPTLKAIPWNEIKVHPGKHAAYSSEPATTPTSA